MKGITWESTSLEMNFEWERGDINLRARGIVTGPLPYAHLGDLRERIEALLNGADLTGRPKIEKVIFNDPATIILWTDGTKTVVKCQPGDIYDKEKGFAMAYLKKLLGNNNTFNKEINKWVPSESPWDYYKRTAQLERVKFSIPEDDLKAIKNEMDLSKILDVKVPGNNFREQFKMYRRTIDDAFGLSKEALSSTTDEDEGCDICRKDANKLRKRYGLQANENPNLADYPKKIYFTHCPFCGRKLKEETK